MHLPGKGCIHCGYAFFSMFRQGCYKNAAMLHGDLLSATNLQQMEVCRGLTVLVFILIRILQTKAFKKSSF